MEFQVSEAVLPPAASAVLHPPGPSEWPILGNPASVLGIRNIVRYAEQQWRRYGDVTRINMMGHRMTLLSHPDHLQRVLLSDRAKFVKGSAYDSSRRVMGDSLITLDGSAWRTRRSQVQPAFHRRALDRLCAIMVQRGAHYFDGLLARTHGEPTVLDVSAEMKQLTFDVVINALLGPELIDSYREVSFDDLGLALKSVSDSFSSLPLPAWLPTPGNLRFARVLRSLDRTVYALIEAGLKRPSHDGSMLPMLFAARDENDQPLSAKGLRDEIFSLFLAGYESTALTLTWLFTLLDGRADVQRRMQNEVDSVLDGRDPVFADVPKLTYLRQVVDETLRLRPPAPMVARNATEDTMIAGYHVQRGEMVVPFFWAVHRHPDFWPHPEQFDPERFAPAIAKTHYPASYMPFSAGPRICIGVSFSLTETVVLIAQMLNRFEIRVLPCSDIRPLSAGTVRPSRPVRVQFTSRKRRARADLESGP